MKATTLRYLRAVGSILDIAPQTDYARLVKNAGYYPAIKGDSCRIGGDFERVIGRSFPKRKSDD